MPAVVGRGGCCTSLLYRRPGSADGLGYVSGGAGTAWASFLDRRYRCHRWELALDPREIKAKTEDVIQLMGSPMILPSSQNANEVPAQAASHEPPRDNQRAFTRVTIHPAARSLRGVIEPRVEHQFGRSATQIPPDQRLRDLRVRVRWTAVSRCSPWLPVGTGTPRARLQRPIDQRDGYRDRAGETWLIRPRPSGRAEPLERRRRDGRTVTTGRARMPPGCLPWRTFRVRS